MYLSLFSSVLFYASLMFITRIKHHQKTKGCRPGPESVLFHLSHPLSAGSHLIRLISVVCCLLFSAAAASLSCSLCIFFCRRASLAAAATSAFRMSEHTFQCKTYKYYNNQNYDHISHLSPAFLHTIKKYLSTSDIFCLKLIIFS